MDLVRAAAVGFGGKEDVWSNRVRTPDQALPHRAWNLICRIAAEAVETQVHVVRDDVAKERDDRLAFGPLRPIELGEIVPNGPLRRIAGIDRERRVDRAIVIVHVPLRALGDEGSVLRGMVDDRSIITAMPAAWAASTNLLSSSSSLSRELPRKNGLSRSNL